jgi:two-component system nitrate/nitrite response regulator NarL
MKASAGIGRAAPAASPNGTGSAVGPPTDRPRSQRVLVLDSDLLMAEAVVIALTQLTFVARFVVPVTAEHVRDVLAWHPASALLDVDSVDRATCIACVTTMREAGVPVAVMGGRADLLLISDCMNAGAASVVDKASPLTDLLDAIVRLSAGDLGFAEEARQRILAACQREARARRDRLAPFDVLTRREKVVLAELVEGRSPDAIAASSSVSIWTVRSHIKAILQKLGVNSQLAAAALARRAGWSLPEDDRATVPALEGQAMPPARMGR